jgi:hypothetical protein
MRGQGDLAGRTARHVRSEQDVRAVLHQRDEADLRIGAFAVAGARPAEGGLQRGLVRDVERAAVEADQPPMLEPGALGRRRRDRPHRLVVQPAQDLVAEPRASLRNAGFPRHLDRRREASQPLETFQQPAQHLSARRIHEERHRDDVVYHDMSGQFTLANARLAGFGQYCANFGVRERFGDHAQADKIGSPLPRRKRRRDARHRSGPLIRRGDGRRTWLTNS